MTKFLAAILLATTATASAQGVWPTSPPPHLMQPTSPPTGKFTPWPPQSVTAPPQAEAKQEPLVQHPVYRPETPQQGTRVIRYSSPILPPVEFDKPYAGKLMIRRVDSKEEVQRVCQLSRPTVGCAVKPVVDMCIIVIADDAAIAARGWTYEIVLRHEIGHCNGWPGDHPGARSSETARTN
jgi:hypothetical protein